MADNTETVTLKLPTGEEVDAIVPAGMSDDEIKTRTKLKYPDMFGPPAANISKPSADMKQVGVLTGLPEYNPMEPINEVAGMVKDAAKTTGYLAAAAPTAFHRSLQAAGIAPKGNVFPGEHTPEQLQREDLPNAAVMVAGGMGGGEGESVRPRGKTVAPVPKAELPPAQQAISDAELSPAQQAKYTDKLDAANEAFKADSKKFHEAAGAENRRSAIARDLSTSTEELRKGVQSLYAEQRSRLDQGWNHLRDEVGAQTPTSTAEVIKAIKDAKELDLRGSPSSLKQFTDLLAELGLDKYGIDKHEGTIVGRPVEPGAPTDWQTMRTHSSALGRAKASLTIPDNVKRGLGRVQDAAETSLAETTRKLGYGREYEALKDTEYRFQKDFEDLGAVSLGRGNPLARLVRAPNAEYAQGHITGKGGDILADTLDRWDPTGKTGKEVRRLRQIDTESKALPKGKVPEPPKLKKVERPKPPEKEAPEPKGTGKIARVARRVGLKVLGGKVAGFPGYIAGGELDTEIERRIRARQTVPQPPE